MLLWWWLSEVAHAHGTTPIRGVYDWSNLPDLEPGGWIVWEFYPSIVLGCGGLWALYAWLAGPGRLKYGLSDVGPSTREWVLFTTSLLVVFFSLQGPLHELSDVYLFSGHMIQHLSITLLFPPLFIAGIPPWMWTPAVRIPSVAAFGRWLTGPVVAYVIAIGALYLWHVPSMYEWAMADHDVHIVEHLTFMASAVVMWWPAYSRISEVPPLTPGKRMIYLFLVTLPMKVLGAIITVSDYILYPFYSTQPRVFGLDPLADQRLGGLIMWIPGGLVFWVTIGFIFFTTYYQDFANQRRGERSAAAVATS